MNVCVYVFFFPAIILTFESDDDEYVVHVYTYNIYINVVDFIMEDIIHISSRERNSSRPRQLFILFFSRAQLTP